MKNPAVPSQQLTTSDAQGRRLWVYPSDVSGKFRRRRNVTNVVLLVVFLLLPWIRINGNPALLIDFVQGRFAVLGLSFWAHDAPMLLFVVGGAAVTLAFVTSVWGRVWCGWACPQTVFVDGVFRRLERWIEGDAVTRRRLDGAVWDAKKIAKKTLKWALFCLVALVLSHSFIAYFIGVDALTRMMAESPSKSPGAFGAMFAIAAAVLFDFGWFREQFCTLLCPYGRFQSVLMDESSLVVAYDSARSDCVSCNRCVNVCPTGIDIRNGLQLECIACTACIDACDAVMIKVRKPTGLIKYASTAKVSGRRLSGRSAAYLAVLIVGGIGLTWILRSREPIEVTLIRAVGAPYQEITRAEGGREVVNHFKVDVMNQSFEPIKLQLDEAREDGARLIAAQLPLELSGGESRRLDLFVRFEPRILDQGRSNREIIFRGFAQGRTDPIVLKQEVPLVGPIR